MRTRTVAVGALLLLLVAAPALAQPRFEDAGSVPADADVRLDLRVPESDDPDDPPDHRTIRVEVHVPGTWTPGGCAPPDGWDCVLTGTVVRFREQPRSRLSLPTPIDDLTFGLLVRSPGTNGTYAFRVVQGYNDGHETLFTEPGGTAPTATVVGGSAPGGSSGGGSSRTPPPAASTSRPAPAAGTTGSGTSSPTPDEATGGGPSAAPTEAPPGEVTATASPGPAATSDVPGEPSPTAPSESAGTTPTPTPAPTEATLTAVGAQDPADRARAATVVPIAAALVLAAWAALRAERRRRVDPGAG